MPRENPGHPLIPFAWTRRDLRLASGLILFTYIALHLTNHALGLVSLSFAEAGLRIAVSFWQSLPGTTLLYGAAATHFLLSPPTGRTGAHRARSMVAPFSHWARRHNAAPIRVVRRSAAIHTHRLDIVGVGCTGTPIRTARTGLVARLYGSVPSFQPTAAFSTATVHPVRFCLAGAGTRRPWFPRHG